MEEVTEAAVTIKEAQGFSRLHVGFLAQDVRQALADCCLDGEGDQPTRSMWGLLVYDPQADLYLLRYDEFVALLTLGLQSLEARVSRVEALLGNSRS